MFSKIWRSKKCFQIFPQKETLALWQKENFIKNKTLAGIICS